MVKWKIIILPIKAMFEIKSDNSWIPKLDKTAAKEIKEDESKAISKGDHKEKAEKSTTRATKVSITKEITIDQGPLEEVKFGLVDDQESDDESKLEKSTPGAAKQGEKNDEQPSKDLPLPDASSSSAQLTSAGLIENQKAANLKLTICEQHQKLNIARTFKLLKDDLILSCSPFIDFQMPFLLLESLKSTDDQLRKYLPASYMNYLKSDILLRDSSQGALSPSQTVRSSFNII